MGLWANVKKQQKDDTCLQCNKSSWLDGKWNVYDQKCLACGIRICKNMYLIKITEQERDARIEANILDWVEYGALESELRRLVDKAIKSQQT